VRCIAYNPEHISHGSWTPVMMLVMDRRLLIIIRLAANGLNSASSVAAWLDVMIVAAGFSRCPLVLCHLVNNTALTQAGAPSQTTSASMHLTSFQCNK